MAYNKDDFLNHMDNWIERFRNAQAVDPEIPIQIPGDFERLMEEKRSKEGVNLLQAVKNDLFELSKKFDVPFLD